jgi:hypothetical protein
LLFGSATPFSICIEAPTHGLISHANLSSNKSYILVATPQKLFDKSTSAFFPTQNKSNLEPHVAAKNGITVK